MLVRYQVSTFTSIAHLVSLSVEPHNYIVLEESCYEAHQRRMACEIRRRVS